MSQRLTLPFSYNRNVRDSFFKSLVSFNEIKMSVMPCSERRIERVVCDNERNSILLCFMRVGECVFSVY